ncbi:MAG TPA: hypothetical protein VIS99_14355 [Terrimicrobiaceae bacterium]
MTTYKHPGSGNLVAFDSWIKSLNKTRVTGHRWRQQFPWLKTVNIFGRLYISRDTIADFERRALGGELERQIRPAASSEAAKRTTN